MTAKYTEEAEHAKFDTPLSKKKSDQGEQGGRMMAKFIVWHGAMESKISYAGRHIITVHETNDSMTNPMKRWHVKASQSLCEEMNRRNKYAREILALKVLLETPPTKIHPTPRAHRRLIEHYHPPTPLTRLRYEPNDVTPHSLHRLSTTHPEAPY